MAKFAAPIVLVEEILKAIGRSVNARREQRLRDALAGKASPESTAAVAAAAVARGGETKLEPTATAGAGVWGAPRGAGARSA